MSRFALIEEAGDGERHAIEREAEIGREGCEILVSDEEASRRHARVRIVRGKAKVEDLGSRNGTFVNEERLEKPRTLDAGDRVRVGGTVLRLEVEEEEEPVAAPAEPTAAPAKAKAAKPAKAEPANPARGESRRGDVPQPPEVVPSVVRKAPAIEPAGAPGFVKPKPRRIRGSAARRGAATLFSYAVIIATAVALVIYFAGR